MAEVFYKLWETYGKNPKSPLFVMRKSLTEGKTNFNDLLDYIDSYVKTAIKKEKFDKAREGVVALMHITMFLRNWHKLGKLINEHQSLFISSDNMWRYIFLYYKAIYSLFTLRYQDIIKINQLLKDCVIFETSYINGKISGKYLKIPNYLTIEPIIYQKIIGIPCINLEPYLYYSSNIKSNKLKDVLYTIHVFNMLINAGLYENVEKNIEIIKKHIDANMIKYLTIHIPIKTSSKDIIFLVELFKHLSIKSGDLLHYYYYDLIFHFITSEDIQIKNDVLFFLKNFSYDIYILFKAVKWRIGEISFKDFYTEAYRGGVLGIFDYIFVLDKFIRNVSYINFSNSLNLYIGTKKVSLRNTYLRTFSALVGLSYLLVFKDGKRAWGSLRQFLEKYAQELYPKAKRLYDGKIRTKRRLYSVINQDISRIRKVFYKKKINPDISIDLDFYKVEGPRGPMVISNSHNFYISSRYGLVLSNQPDSWAEEFKKKAFKVRRDFLNHLVDNML